MRLIDADALMEIYMDRLSIVADRYSPDSSECGILTGAMKLLDEQPTIEPESQWISCSERLPEYGTAVLTCDDYGECEINHIIDEDDGEWFWNDVVAWMPLPKPWRGEGP